MASGVDTFFGRSICPCASSQGQMQTKTVVLNFKRIEFLDDLKQNSYVAGDIMPGEDEHRKHQVFDIAEDGNVDRVTRVLNLTMAEVRELLYPYTKSAVDEGDNRVNNLVEVETYTITMTVPEAFSKTTLSYLELLIHELIIDRIMFDWLSQTYPDAAKTWEEKAEKTLAKIQETKNKRMRRGRRTMTPF